MDDRPRLCCHWDDGAGDDAYLNHGGGWGANGGAIADTGAGFLVHQDGNDVYEAGGQGVNGGASWLGVGFLDDRGGSDTYLAGEWATNGASRGAFGRLIDHAGDDFYMDASIAVNGGALGVTHCVVLVCAPPAGSGLLLDLGGSDRCSDSEGGSGEDRTVPVKGTVGAQIGAP